MTTFNITGSISTNDPISASYAPSSGGGIGGMAYFTSSTTWTVPSGIKNIRVIAIGAGGGGSQGPAGGGGGGYAESVISVEGFSTLPVTVGVGGSYGFYVATDGGDSGILNITASGGKGGISGGADVLGGNGISASICVSGQSGNISGGGMSGNVPWVFSLPTALQNEAYYLTSIGSGGYAVRNGMTGSVVIYY